MTARPLSPRERQVYDLAAKLLSSKQIAAALGMSPKTVDQHLNHVRNKGYTVDRSANKFRGTIAP